MPVVHYPFIDIAVHERVRERFVAGDAVVLLSTDLDMVLWSNGRGARLFGSTSVHDFLDQAQPPQNLVLRQIATARQRLSEIGDVSNFTVRMAFGFRMLPVAARCELVEVAGTPAVLFSTPVEQGSQTANQSAAAMLEGLEAPDTHMAVVDAHGDLIAASSDFSTLGLTPATSRMLITMVESDTSHLVKRPVSTAKGYLPAAIGKLSDTPGLHLLLIIEAHPAGMDPVPAPDSDDDDAVLTAKHTDTAPTDVTNSINQISTPAVAPQLLQNTPAEVQDSDELSGPATEDEELIATDATAHQLEDTTDLAEHDTETSALAPEAEREPIPSPLASPAPAASNHGTFVFQRDSRAMRFVWKIDAGGRFSEISDEFAATVGPNAAAINGMTFNEVAGLLQLDPDGKIGELLGKRDTWSGKTIWWPVEGTSLSVPIDLAALPTYTRERIFDGFRGFGIVRVGDAIEDPYALGLTFSREPENDDAPVEINAQEGATATDEPHIAERSEDADPGETGSFDLTGEHVGEGEQADRSPDEDAPGHAETIAARNEIPALRIVKNSPSQGSNRIIQLPEGRIYRAETLSPVEQASFKEIARQLDGLISRSMDGGTASDRDKAETIPSLEIANEDDGNSPAGDQSHGELPSPDSGKAKPSDEHVLASDSAVGEKRDTDLDFTPDQSGLPEEHTDPDETEHSLVSPALPAHGLPVRERTGLNAEIVDQMPVALLLHNGDTLIHGNPEFLRLTGYPALDALAEIGGLDALLQRQDLAENGATGMVIVRADDTVVPVTARLQSVRFEEATALMLALMPITNDAAIDAPAPTADIIPHPDMPAVEENRRLLVEVEELSAILETATDGVVLINSDNSIRSMNRSASALFNYDNDETNGKPFVMLFAHESQKATIDYLGGLSEHGVASVLNDGREVIGREASGGFIPLFMTIGKLTSSDGYCAVIRDITQWKRTEEELRTAKRSAEMANTHKSEFLAHVSHEIRTPLNAIIGFADLMASERFGTVGHPRYVEYANDIVRSGRHVLDIVNDLLDISKIEAGEMELEFVSVELFETVSEAISLVQPQANSQRVIIRTALSHSVPPVVADLRSVKQIVLNILSNAIRFTPSGGQIVVSTAYEANGSVVLRVRDTGVGMTRQELELAMKPFRQVASSTRKRGDGTGLGLPLTKAMVDANRASFSINSVPREGTLVEITFPPQRVLAN